MAAVTTVSSDPRHPSRQKEDCGFDISYLANRCPVIEGATNTQTTHLASSPRATSSWVQAGDIQTARPSFTFTLWHASDSNYFDMGWVHDMHLGLAACRQGFYTDEQWGLWLWVDAEKSKKVVSLKVGKLWSVWISFFDQHLVLNTQMIHGGVRCSLVQVEYSSTRGKEDIPHPLVFTSCRKPTKA